LSACRGRHHDEDDGEDPGGRETSFDENQRRKTRDQRKGSDASDGNIGGGDGKGSTAAFATRRRKSSRLSHYSGDGKHVIQKPFSIAAFNVKRFGMSKMKDSATVETLVRLLVGFDLMMVQEVVDVSGKAVEMLLEEANKDPGDAGELGVLVSERVGRSHQKEQYAVFYRKNKVQILDSRVYSDPGDIFSREPFIVDIRVPGLVSGVQELTLVCIHTQPTAANREIDELCTVHKHVSETLGAKNVIILGDFNAGGAYIRSQDWEKNRLRGPGFTWLIPDHMDTTATNTLAAYDRIVLSGSSLVSSVVAGTAGVYRYDQIFNIDQEQLLKVSDHYPVCFSLRSTVHPALEKNICRRLGLIVEDRRLPAMDPLVLMDQFKVARFKIRSLYDASGTIKIIEIRSQRFSRPSDVVSSLEKLRSFERTLVSYSTLAALNHQFEERSSSEDWLVKEEKGKFMVLLVVDLEANNVTCSVEINHSFK